MKARVYLILGMFLAGTSFVSCGSDDSGSSDGTNTTQKPSQGSTTDDASLLGKTFTKTTTSFGELGEKKTENISITFLPAPHCTVRQWESQEVINSDGTRTTDSYDTDQMIAYYSVSGSNINIKLLKQNFTFSETIEGSGLKGYEQTNVDETIRKLPTATEGTSDMVGYYNRGYLRQLILEDVQVLVDCGDTQKSSWESCVNSRYYDWAYRIVDRQNIHRVLEYASLTPPIYDWAFVWATDTFNIHGVEYRNYVPYEKDFTYIIYYIMETAGEGEGCWQCSYTMHGDQMMIYFPEKDGNKAGYGLIKYEDNTIKLDGENMDYKKVTK